MRARVFNCLITSLTYTPRARGRSRAFFAAAGCLRLENGSQLEAAALLLLRKLSSSQQLAATLLKLGAEPLLAEIKARSSSELRPVVDSALAAVMTPATEVRLTRAHHQADRS